MNIKRTDWTMCEECADIVVQGYTDLISDVVTHQARCNLIDKRILPAGEYWGSYTEKDHNEHLATCDGCGVKGAQFTGQSLKNTQ